MRVRTWRFLASAAIAAALVMAALPAEPEQAVDLRVDPPQLAAEVQTNPYRGDVGVTSHTFWLGENDAAAELAPLADAGVEWVREDLSWAATEPQNDQFDWSRIDNLMAAASRNQISVLGIVDYSAPWASSDPSGGGDPHYPPTDLDEYAEFAREIAKRYGEQGTFWASRPDLTHRSLKALELWNEPWGTWFWKSGPDPVRYADMAKRAATEIKAHAPDLEVLVPGDLLQVRSDGALVGWIDNVMLAEPALDTLVDAYSVHAYPYPFTHGPYDDRPDPRWDFQRLQVIDDTMKALGKGKPIWVTEVGWSTVVNHSDGVSEATQADYVRGAIISGLNDYPAVERVFIFTWDKDNGVVGDREGQFGLRHPDGSAKPAWNEIVALLALTPAGEQEPAVASSVSMERGGAVLAPQFQMIDGAIEVTLSWQDIPDDDVDIFMDDVVLQTVGNGADGSGSFTVPASVPVTGETVFRVCAANSWTSCSAEIQVTG
jgi:hypothetical protein